MRDKEQNDKMPTAYVIAGPNGAGKTTFALRFLPKITECRNFVNADLIAKGLSPLDVDAEIVKAGRIFIKRIYEQIERRVSFGFETTLAGLGYVRMFKHLRQKGFRICLYFLWIPSPSLALKRISGRVRLGGHNVPVDVVRRRYRKGVRNLIKTYLTLTDYCAIFDNSSLDPVLVFERKEIRENVVLPEIFNKIIKQAEAEK